MGNTVDGQRPNALQGDNASMVCDLFEKPTRVHPRLRGGASLQNRITKQELRNEEEPIKCSIYFDAVRLARMDARSVCAHVSAKAGSLIPPSNSTTAISGRRFSLMAAKSAASAVGSWNAWPGALI